MKRIGLILIITVLIGVKLTAAQGPPPGFPYISEIMYNPPESGVDSLDFIEISPDYVSGSVEAGWYFSSGIDFTFPTGPDYYQQVVVIAKDSVAFENAFGVPAFQWHNSSLLNSGEALVLKTAGGDIIDSVFYQPSAPWPTEADGTGRSIEYCSIMFEFNHNPVYWSASQNNTGMIVNGMTVYASPGVHTGNCLTVGMDDLPETDMFQVFPNPSNGEINLRFPLLTEYGTLNVFDSRGALIRSDGIPEGTTELRKNFGLPSGMYLVKLESEAEGFQTRLVIID